MKIRKVEIYPPNMEESTPVGEIFPVLNGNCSLSFHFFIQLIEIIFHQKCTT